MSSKLRPQSAYSMLLYTALAGAPLFFSAIVFGENLSSEYSALLLLGSAALSIGFAIALWLRRGWCETEGRLIAKSGFFVVKELSLVKSSAALITQYAGPLSRLTRSVRLSVRSGVRGSFSLRLHETDARIALAALSVSTRGRAQCKLYFGSREGALSALFSLSFPFATFAFFAFATAFEGYEIPLLAALSALLGEGVYVFSSCLALSRGAVYALSDCVSLRCGLFGVKTALLPERGIKALCLSQSLPMLLAGRFNCSALSSAGRAALLPFAGAQRTEELCRAIFEHGENGVHIAPEHSKAPLLYMPSFILAACALVLFLCAENDFIRLTALFSALLPLERALLQLICAKKSGAEVYPNMIILRGAYGLRFCEQRIPRDNISLVRIYSSPFERALGLCSAEIVPQGALRGIRLRCLDEERAAILKRL